MESVPELTPVLIELVLAIEVPSAVTLPNELVMKNTPPAFVEVGPPRFSMSRMRWPLGLMSVNAKSEMRGYWTTMPTFTVSITFEFETKMLVLVTASTEMGDELVEENRVGCGTAC